MALVGHAFWPLMGGSIKVMIGGFLSVMNDNSYRDIARSLNISTTTVYDHLARAKIAGISWPLPEGISEDDLYNKLFLPTKNAPKQRPLPDWEWVY